MAITTDYNLEIRPGDEVGVDTALVCCGQTMTAAAPDKYGDRTHTCGGCRVQVDIDALGLVDDIRD